MEEDNKQIHIKTIKEAFEKMHTKQDLLNLLNMVSEVQDVFTRNSFQNRITIISLKDLFNDAEVILEPVLEKKRKQGITEKQLDFFSSSFDTKEKKRKRYSRFFIKKKSGDLREIKAPLPKLKEIQRALNVILQTVYKVQESAYGFVQGKNIADNARVHAGARFLLNVDIKDFFPSIYFKRIKIMLEKPPFLLTGHREPLSFLIANLCTEDGVLPQGAPTSPLLTNIICQRLDKRLQELAAQFNARYSRYADDISFSSNDYIFTKRFMQRLEKILKADRFEINPKKTRIQGKAFRQEVTGLTINEKVNVSRQFRRSYRTLLHLYHTKGPEKALEYYARRMPENIVLSKGIKKINNPRSYMKKVLSGKYYFMFMVNRDLLLPHPFVKKTSETDQEKIILQLQDLIDTKPQRDNGNKENQYYNVSTQEIMDFISEESVLYSPVAKGASRTNLSIIEEVLSVWENDNNGFKKAMEIIKQQINEQ